MKIVLPLLALVLLLAACTSTDKIPVVSSFDECVQAGYPVMKSYPAQCSADGVTFTQEVDDAPSVVEQFVICSGEAVTGFDPVQHAEAIGGTCVDACPDGFDAFMTQIGVELCIQHYGKQEIAAWPTCTRSSSGCQCVKAYETTEAVVIENPDYRCVPDLYAQRLLFRSGMDQLDENGEQSVMIA